MAILWQNTGYISTGYDAGQWCYAYDNYNGVGVYGFAMIGTGFGFSVTAGATITGVVLYFYGSATAPPGNGAMTDQYPYVGLTYAGSVLGTVVSSGTPMAANGGLTTTGPPTGLVCNMVLVVMDIRGEQR